MHEWMEGMKHRNFVYLVQVHTAEPGLNPVSEQTVNSLKIWVGSELL